MNFDSGKKMTNNKRKKNYYAISSKITSTSAVDMARSGICLAACVEFKDGVAM